MKDTKTVLPMVNGSGNGENKNGFQNKNKTQENGNDDEYSTTTTTLKSSSDHNEELVGGCCVCSDDQGFANNALVYCDGKGCTVACHTACYGIVTIPDGDWYCGRCEAGDIRAPCRLCPTIEGAMKRTADNGWAHVVCALYIPEVSFGDDTTMEPIILSKVPSSRFGQECSICVQNGRSKLIATSGACCGCTVKNCSRVFHVTCAQANGLLCEDVRKNNCQYPIYCEQHRPKLSKFIRQIQAFQYSPNALASVEQLKQQRSFLKEKESPSQLSDFVAAAAAEAAATEIKTVRVSSASDDTHNQTSTSDEQQTPIARTSFGIDMLKRKSSSNTNSSVSSAPSSTPNSPTKKTKLNEETNNSSPHNTSNRSLNDLSQFVQLNKEERNSSSTSETPADESDKTAKLDSSTKETKEKSNDNSKPSSKSSIEEKSLTSRFISSPNEKLPGKQRHSTESLPTNIKISTVKKPTASKVKDDDDEDEDFEIHKKRKLSIKLNKDGQPRKKRQHSVEGVGPRPVGRPPSKKTLLAQQTTNSLKHSSPKSSMSTNMKQQKVVDVSINLRKISDIENDDDIKPTNRSTHYYPCDNFGNQINADILKQHGYSDEQVKQVSAQNTDTNNEASRTRAPSSSATTTTRIDFYPRRPLQNAAALSSTVDQQQRAFPPQTLEEFLEQEWELSSDFVLQQSMPHDVSSLLSCLYQFKSENASLQKKFEELKHRRDSLRVTNANLRRRLSEILPLSDAITPSSSVTTTATAATTTATAVLTTTTTTTTPIIAVTPTTLNQVSPSGIPLPPAQSLPSAIVSAVPPSPRKEQQQLKQQKLLAELELQQQLQQQKAISPSRRRLSINTNAQYTDSGQSTIKKSKSPRQTNTLTHPSLLENQLRQSASAAIPISSISSTKKVTVTTIPNKKNIPSSELELVSHHQPTTTNPPVIPTTASTTSTAPFEQIDVTTTAAAAYALAKNGRTPPNPGLSLELLSQILAASGTAIGPQLFAPTWNISNFGYANFPGATPMSVADDPLLRAYAPSTQSSLEQPQQQTSTKQQP